MVSKSSVLALYRSDKPYIHVQGCSSGQGRPIQYTGGIDGRIFSYRDRTRRLKRFANTAASLGLRMRSVPHSDGSRLAAVQARMSHKIFFGRRSLIQVRVRLGIFQVLFLNFTSIPFGLE
jgi:hypothetical protein